jgi:hypothetical protein
VAANQTCDDDFLRRAYTQHMSGERLARVTLALDAVYCGLVGLVAIAFRGRIGALVGLPGVVIAALGAAVVGWAYVVLGQTVRLDWRRGIWQTMTANSVVAFLLALGAALHPGRGASALMAFVSLDVMSIAAAQAISLIRGRSKG